MPLKLFSVYIKPIGKCRRWRKKGNCEGCEYFDGSITCDKGYTTDASLVKKQISYVEQQKDPLKY